MSTRTYDENGSGWLGFPGVVLLAGQQLESAAKSTASSVNCTSSS